MADVIGMGIALAISVQSTVPKIVALELGASRRATLSIMGHPRLDTVKNIGSILGNVAVTVSEILIRLDCRSRCRTLLFESKVKFPIAVSIVLVIYLHCSSLSPVWIVACHWWHLRDKYRAMLLEGNITFSSVASITLGLMILNRGIVDCHQHWSSRSKSRTMLLKGKGIFSSADSIILCMMLLNLLTVDCSWHVNSRSMSRTLLFESKGTFSCATSIALSLKLLNWTITAICTLHCTSQIWTLSLLKKIGWPGC